MYVTDRNVTGLSEGNVTFDGLGGLVGVAWDDGGDNEAQRVDVPTGADGRLSAADATGLIGLGEYRPMTYGLLDAFRARDPDGLISVKREATGLTVRCSTRTCWPLWASATPILVRPLASQRKRGWRMC